MQAGIGLKWYTGNTGFSGESDNFTVVPSELLPYCNIVSKSPSTRCFEAQADHSFLFHFLCISLVHSSHGIQSGSFVWYPFTPFCLEAIVSYDSDCLFASVRHSPYVEHIQSSTVRKPSPAMSIIGRAVMCLSGDLLRNVKR